jgi:hypothetical protein
MQTRWQSTLEVAADLAFSLLMNIGGQLVFYHGFATVERVTLLGDFRERFYCDRVSMLNAPQDMGTPHAVGRSYCGHARLDTGIS